MNLKTTFIFVAIMLCSAAFANPIDLLERSTSETERREDGFITVSLKQAQVFSHPTSYEYLQRSTEMREASEVRERTTNHIPKQPIPKTGADSWDNRRRNWHTDGNHEPFSRATEDLLENAESYVTFVDQMPMKTYRTTSGRTSYSSPLLSTG
ncbi:hypothetical protein WG66_005419 [Moniliophthora roreri]|nr:hypothetical protein WG66_005419 [Moniliophthora roreri]